jgi:hypothetical protein
MKAGQSQQQATPPLRMLWPNKAAKATGTAVARTIEEEGEAENAEEHLGIWPISSR